MAKKKKKRAKKHSDSGSKPQVAAKGKVVSGQGSSAQRTENKAPADSGVLACDWVRCELKVTLEADAHPGAGLGGEGVDALVARDRDYFPVIWASHVEGILRDTARRLWGGSVADELFGKSGVHRQRAVFSSLYISDKKTSDNLETHIWRSTSHTAFDNRAPKADTLRVIEYVPKGRVFCGEVQLPADQLPRFKQLVKHVDAFGAGRATGAGRVSFEMEPVQMEQQKSPDRTNERLILLFKNIDPISIPAATTPFNFIRSLAYIPGRIVLGALVAWLLDENSHEQYRQAASLLTSGIVTVSDALPLPGNFKEKHLKKPLSNMVVLPAPLALQSEKPKGSAGFVPWWAQEKSSSPARLSAFDRNDAKDNKGAKLKRPEDDLFVCRIAANESWEAYQPARRIRLRNGRPDPRQKDTSLFAIEQIVENTYFLAEIQGPIDAMKTLAEKLSPVLSGQRWLRVGTSGAPVEVVKAAFLRRAMPNAKQEMVMTLTSDLLVRDEQLRWKTHLDETDLQQLLDTDQIRICRSSENASKQSAEAIAAGSASRDMVYQEAVPVHGFNGTSRIWRAPAMAIRRGSVFVIEGEGIRHLVQRIEKGQWLGERTHEGYGRFRLDGKLPGIVEGSQHSSTFNPFNAKKEERIAEVTTTWVKNAKALINTADSGAPSLSQWYDLVAELESNVSESIQSRLNPKAKGSQVWKHRGAETILKKLLEIEQGERALYARYFVRRLRIATPRRES